MSLLADEAIKPGTISLGVLSSTTVKLPSLNCKHIFFLEEFKGVIYSSQSKGILLLFFKRVKVTLPPSQVDTGMILVGAVDSSIFFVVDVHEELSKFISLVEA